MTNAQSPSAEQVSERAIIDLDALRGAELRSDPSAWAMLTDAFSSPATAAELAETFPEDGFEWHAQYELLSALGRAETPEARKHCVRTRALIERGAAELSCPERLSTPWRSLGEQLLSPSYREALEQLSGLELGVMQTHFWRFEPGSWFDPHVDKQVKVVTHLMYFNRDWEASWGACLRILGSGDIEDVVEELPPRLGNAAVLVNSPSLWHGVSAVEPGRGTRNVLQTWFSLR